MLHSKTKGNVGELRVAADLSKRGFAVFTELGDSSKIDLIAIKESQIIRIQVKTQTDTSNGTICAPLRSCGPGYSYLYTANDVDVIAVYAMDKEVICYVPIISFGKKTKMILRFEKSKNNQTKGIHFVEDYQQI